MTHVIFIDISKAIKAIIYRIPEKACYMHPVRGEHVIIFR